MKYKTIKWENQKMLLIDQTKIPNQVEYHVVDSVEETFRSIRTMIVRGAPAIGVAAGYGMYFAAAESQDQDLNVFLKKLKEKGEYLVSSRPTAVNLEWAVNRIIAKAEDLVKQGATFESILQEIEKEAVLIHREDIEINKKIGRNLLSLVKDGDTILTHCNAGSLATSEYGTALSVFYVAQEKGITLKAYADETRPRLQGANLTSFELYEAGVDVTVITDNMAALVMSQGKIDAIIVGCDRVAANGDVANKIGTFSVALLAKHFDIPFYVATPTPTIDLDCACGDKIPIEERDGDEIRKINGKYVTPKDVKVYNPGFDVTPHEYIDAIVTEQGVIRQPYTENLKKLI